MSSISPRTAIWKYFGFSLGTEGDDPTKGLYCALSFEEGGTEASECKYGVLFSNFQADFAESLTYTVEIGRGIVGFVSKVYIQEFFMVPSLMSLNKGERLTAIGDCSRNQNPIEKFPNQICSTCGDSAIQTYEECDDSN